MARPFRLDRGQPLFDVGSHGRAGPGRRLSRSQIEQIRRTVTRVPEGWSRYRAAVGRVRAAE